MNKVLITILIIILSQSIYAQKTTVSTVDITTYNQYLNGEWEELIKTSKKAQSNEIDFYYLQVRMGVAYYKLGNYRKAINHFENAFYSSPTDAFVREYLYYSYLYAGRESDAVIFAKILNLDMKKQLKIKKTSFIQGLQSEYGYFFNKDYNSQTNTNYVRTEDLYAEQTVPKNYNYFNFGLKHAFGNGTTFYHSYTNLKINKLQQYQTKQIQQQQPHNSDNYEYSFTTNQHQYYASFGFHPKTGLTITPALHFIKINSTSFDMNYDGTNNPSFNVNNYSINQFLLYLGVAKDIGLITVGVSGSYSNLNDKKQFQPGISLIYYPLGNLNIYTASFLYYQSNSTQTKKEASFIFNQKIGFKLSKIWIEGLVTFGNFSEFNDAAGFIVYNSLDKIQSRYEGAILIPTNDGRFNISLRYQNLSYQGEVKQSETYSISNYTTFNYTNHLFIGGISWDF